MSQYFLPFDIEICKPIIMFYFASIWEAQNAITLIFPDSFNACQFYLICLIPNVLEELAFYCSEIVVIARDDSLACILKD